MGTARSKSDSSRTDTLPKYEQAIALFSAEELSEIKLVFHRICSSKNPESKETVFHEEQLKRYIDSRVPDKMGSKLFWILCNNGKSQSVSSEEDFIIAIADLTKGMVEQQAHVLYTLGVSEDNMFTLSSFREVLQVFLDCYDVILRSCEVNLRAADTAVTNVFVDMAMRDLQDGDIESSMDVSKWLLNKPLVQSILNDIMHYCFLIKHNEAKEVCSTDSAVVYTSPLLPTFLDVDWNQFRSILNVPSLLLINHQLPHDLRHTWRLVYSIDAHGASFSTLVNKISLQGPSILIVRDSGGHVFGGFASVSWHVGPNFIGSSQSFLFTLSPSMAIFESSSINEHYMYMNMDQETLPNGLGMGGQFDYFGLWLDQDFGAGHSKCHPKCTTYDSPQLSSSEQFTIDVLEVWAVGEVPSVKEVDDDQRCSILDKDPEAKALLDIIGKERKSEGLREDPGADIPEIHQLPPM